MNENLKNIKDLEYNNLLNNQNIILVLIGTAVISMLITNFDNFLKLHLILFLVSLGAFSLFYFNKELNKIKEEIQKL